VLGLYILKRLILIIEAFSLSESLDIWTGSLTQLINTLIYFNKQTTAIYTFDITN